MPLPNVKNNDNPRNKVLRNSEEPFLHLITIQAQAPSAGQFFQPEFFFENSGLTPAHELQMKSYIWPTTTNLGDTFEYPEVAGDVVTITVAPHESRSVKLKSNIALTQELVAQIESHQLLIYVYARTLFRDSANQWFRWRFCAVYNPDGHDFDLCKYGNDSVKTKKPSRSDP